MEQVVADGNGLAAYQAALSPAHAVALQPLACVLYAVEQLPDLTGRHVAVRRARVRSGCCSPTSPRRRAPHTSPGSTPSTATDIGPSFGVDTVVRATSDRWVSHLSPDAKPDIVIEAVGHQVATLGHAVEAAAFGGTVFYFGVPDDDSYPISMRTMLRNNLTLKSGVTLDRGGCWRRPTRSRRPIPACWTAT